MPTAIVKERIDDLNLQLARSAAAGFLKGTLFGLVSGVLLTYRYSHGVNKGFFRMPYQVSYVVCCGVVGLSISAEKTTQKLSKQIMVEEELRRDAYINGR